MDTRPDRPRASSGTVHAGRRRAHVGAPTTRRAERLRLFDGKVLHRADIELRRTTGWNRNDAVASLLRFSNIDIVEIGGDRPLRGRFAMFPHLTFAHISGPPTRVLWPRDEGSLDRVLVLITRVGRMSVETEGPVRRRAPGLVVVSPDDTTVAISLLDAENEIFYISVSPALLDGIALPSTSATMPEPLAAPLLVPSMMFIAALCRISTTGADGASPLRTASQEIARTVVRQVIGTAVRPAGLFARGMELIVAEHADPQLNPGEIARRLGAAPRTLQFAFGEEGTTVGAQLRDVRTRAALRLRDASPSLSSGTVWRAVGFGSSSAFHRALRSTDAAAP